MLAENNQQLKWKIFTASPEWREILVPKLEELKKLSTEFLVDETHNDPHSLGFNRGQIHAYKVLIEELPLIILSELQNKEESPQDEDEDVL